MASSSKGKAPANGNASNTTYELPWYRSPLPCSECQTNHIVRVEKFRPQVLDDVVGNEDTIDRLKVIAKDGNCPHIIISVSTILLVV